MTDPYLFLAPLLLLPIICLLSFVGCLGPPGTEIDILKVRINCGGPAIASPYVGWEADLDNAGITQSNVQNPVKAHLNSGEDAGPVYETCRVSNGPPDSVLSYSRFIGQGTASVELRFAWFFTTANDHQPFGFQISGDGVFSPVDNTFNVNVPYFSVPSPAFVKFDHPRLQVEVNESGIVYIRFFRARDANAVPFGNFPYVNAIQIYKQEYRELARGDPYSE